MKKLIIAAAIVCAAVVSQAASVGWSLAGAGDYASGEYNVFIIGQNGVQSVAQIAALVANGGLDAVSSYAWYDGGSITSTGNGTKTASSSGMAITYKEPPATAADNTYTAFIIVESADGKFASYTDSNTQTLANNTSAKTFAFANQSTQLSANKFAVAPEPTSGLLLLLGVAGLALKRRRA